VSIASQLVSVSKEGVLAHWSGALVQGGDARVYLAAYTTVCLLTAVMTCVRFIMVCWMGLRGSRVLHQSLLDAITATNLRFFQVGGLYCMFGSHKLVHASFGAWCDF
jgi:hypothetical protein